MAKRPHNVRQAAAAERTHNSHRHHERAGEPPAGTRSYRGHHRTEHQHRVGRHHADHTGH